MATAAVGALAASPVSASADPVGTTPAATVVGKVVEPNIDCAPTSDHPDPVIVLPGGDGTVSQTPSQWGPMLSALHDAGYCALLFQGGVVSDKRWAGDIPASAQQLSDFVAKVRQRTGAKRVDIVAHSASTVVSNYFLKVLHGAPEISHAVFLAPEARGCDGAGFLADYGIHNPPITPVEVLQAIPFLATMLTAASPDLAAAIQMTPQSQVYHAIFDGPITQPGVHYSVLSTRHDEVATPPTPCSVISEPGVTMNFYDDLFPDAPAVGHSDLRSSANTTGWVVRQLNT
ncbi:esterase/lipase family protein [Nocardia nova]|uniref:esterase/lipase family protein n=1 Tax=Nocardia nova TaxID=37330 RepID=UPI0033DB349A